MNLPTSCRPSCIVTRIRQFMYSNNLDVLDIDILTGFSPHPASRILPHAPAADLLEAPDRDSDPPTPPLQTPESLKTLISGSSNTTNNARRLWRGHAATQRNLQDINLPGNHVQGSRDRKRPCSDFAHRQTALQAQAEFKTRSRPKLSSPRRKRRVGVAVVRTYLGTMKRGGGR